MTDLIPQVINLNGTSGESLLEQYSAILEALRTAQQAIQNGMPHGRDYQTHRTAFAHMDAQKAFRERWGQIDDLLKEFEACALKVAEQHWERNQRLNQKTG